MANQNTASLTDQIATRERSINFYALGMLLPNPDPVLKAQGRDIQVYRNLRSDALVGGCIRRRKSAVKALDWGLDREQAASRVAKSIKGILDDLDMERIIGQMLDATLYGYQPMEVMWERAGNLLVPVNVEAKPPEWFHFDPENRLRFKSKEQPLYGELLPERKFLLPRQDPTYQNPYGFADLSMCFWPLTFKKGGLKFWLSFTEKFGSAWPVGKLPRSASATERTELLDSLEELIQDGVAVIPDDGSVDIKEVAGKAASADLYEKLVMHCRGEIAIALLGQNQTTEATANKASAASGLEVTQDLRDGDATLVSAAVNQLVRWICDANWGAVDAPIFSMWDQEAQDKLQAERDKSNYAAGARFTNAYWMRGYGYQETDLQPEMQAAVAPVAPMARSAPSTLSASFAESAPSAADAITDQLMAASQSTWQSMLDRVQTVVERSRSMADVQKTLAEAYGGLDPDALRRLMAAAFALAELKGMADAMDDAA